MKNGEENLNKMQRVYDAVCELHYQETPANRETVSALTGLTMSEFDHCAKDLCSQGRLVRIWKGHYEPVTKHQPMRVISRTKLEDGTVKIDVGDTVLALTPREARELAHTLSPDLEDRRAIRQTTDLYQLVTELGSDVSSLARTLKAITKS